MFNASDIYTSVGSNKLYGCWTPNVTKFDTSSFYNWEQDNLPLHDLDERTHLLWERLGNTFSSTTGFALVVSADAVSGCNTNIFTTLSACLNTLPEVINAPFLIEVGSFGNLGNLELSNKIFGPKGSIEIINRNFAKMDPITNSYEFYKERSSGGTYGLASSIYYDATALNAIIPVQEVPSIPINLKKAKILSLNVPVMSGTNIVSGYDTRLNNNVTLFCRKPFQAYNQRLTASLATQNTYVPFSKWDQASAVVSFQPYETNLPGYEQTNSYDAFTIKENNADRGEIVWKDESATSPTIPLLYGNRLNQIKIYNCNGPIYIRNFTVDGGETINRVANGIDIRKSVVVLENCSVSRCAKAGLYVDNSRVTLTRGFVAYRNYGYNSNGTRVGRTWLSKLSSKIDRQTELSYGAGIQLINSELNFSSTYDRDYEQCVSALVLTYGFSYTGVSAVPAASWLFCLSRNDIGIRATNSRIFGGRTELNPPAGVAGLASYVHAHNLISELNTEAGIVLENSTFEHSGKLNLYGNYVGIDANNSTVSVDSLNCKYNQKEGVNLLNSKMSYNNNLYRSSVVHANSTYRVHQMSFFQNGTHVKLINSVFEPTYSDSMPSKYERFVCDESFGMFIFSSIAGVVRENVIPSIIVDSNSKFKAVSLALTNDAESFDSTNQGYFGCGISVLNNSEATLQGTKDYVTKIFGPTTYTLQRTKAGLYAGQNSTIKIQGPTVIAQYGVDVLVDNNSNLEITPHRLRNGTLDVSGFNLGNIRNHTSVEFHATRACLVADHNSTITMKDLGHYYPIWNATNFGQDLINNYGLDLPGTSYLLHLYTSGGSVQFYPNPNDPGAYASLGSNNISVGLYDGNNDVKFNNNLSQNYILPVGQYIGNKANNYQFSSTTNGGVCVRALNGSKVNVDNVHFPCGWWNASSPIYEFDAADGLCSRTFIWIINDSSRLTAKYISVSGTYPASASYFGPSGIWGPSGAPSATPDTGSLPILDFYGQNPSNAILGSPSAVNQGPFRLYFSVDPIINWAVAAGVSAGYIPQVYAQGYQFSSNLVFASGATEFYKSLIIVSGDGAGNYASSTSGFYYGSSIISDPGQIRAFLDESAANTFANAKHNTVGKSGLTKLVEIYLPYGNIAGGDTVVDVSKKPRGRGIGSLNTFDLEKLN